MATAKKKPATKPATREKKVSTAKGKPVPKAKSAAEEAEVQERPPAPWLGDESIQRTQSRVSAIMKTINPAAMVDEMMSKHVTLKARALKIKVQGIALEISQDRLISVEHENLDFRSRCVDIKMQALQAQMQIDEIVDTARGLIMSQYGEDVKQLAGTQAERKSALDATAFAEAVSGLKNLKHVITIADVVIDDLDQASWRVTHIIDILKMTTGKTGK